MAEATLAPADESTDAGMENTNDKENVVMQESATVENRYNKKDNISKPADNDAETTAATTSNSPPKFSPELLRIYYARLFPYDLLYNWMTYDPSCASDPTKISSLFSKREFSFTLESDAGEEIYLRYKCFKTEDELKQDIQKKGPRKIDIGAVFDHYPKDHKSIQIAPQQRELVFDIDLTDYDGIRKCGCSGASICSKCWEFMSMAVKVMEEGLREDFGFQHVAWFYSGRRGVHAWVCDESARLLSNEARSAVAAYFEVSLGSEKNKKIGLTHPLHPMLLRSFKTLEPLFVKYVLPSSGHGVLANEEQWTELLQTLPPVAEAVRDNLLKKWKSITTTPAEKWAELKKHLSVFGNTKQQGKTHKTISSADKMALELWPVSTVFTYTYPRLDINVSKMQNHLLKSPFCVHPKTGRVCVPINANQVDEFDPFAVPTLGELIQELDEFEKKSVEGDRRRDWEKTSLKEHFEPFQKRFLEPLWKDLRRAQREATEEHAAVTGDF